MADTLTFWHPVANTAIDATYFGWSGAVRGSASDAKFRIRNSSTLYSAREVSVYAQDATSHPTPSLAMLHLFSLDGLNFAATVNLGTLVAGALSAPIIVRRVIPPEVPLGTWQFYLSAHAGSWV